jgi:hypothetical protein
MSIDWFSTENEDTHVIEGLGGHSQAIEALAAALTP